MRRWLEAVAHGFAVLGGVCACAVALMVCVSIVGRAAWARPITGDVELTQFGIALAISLCLPWCQARRTHILVDFFTQRASARTQRRLDKAGALLMAATVLLLAWRTGAGAVAVAQAGEASMILDLPMWWTYASLAPGLALAGVIALVDAVAGPAAPGGEPGPEGAAR
ncbi:TRAP transporter small permease [Piscinibacter sakaiensis]|uniref:TRAP transporter small permease protein n=1 Tax=Piscinibacter sakaiensis TaxID=1547922 RepID=A0A0K8NU49_PISS1|nr:TRAP transporter small permease [Piscinibacter sakaiensis]GAP33784.1 TRAP dicarboxylate transporter, DctQ subunit [Piscinibacter sakaiensis]